MDSRSFFLFVVSLNETSSRMTTLQQRWVIAQCPALPIAQLPRNRCEFAHQTNHGSVSGGER
jgi:hypothetical protein